MIYGRRMLLNDWKKTGRDFESFQKTVTLLAEKTEILSVKGEDITILSVCQIPKYQKEGKTVFYILSKDYIENFMFLGEKLHMGTIDNEELGEELLAELLTETGMMIVVDKEKFIISKSTLHNLSQKALVTGYNTMNRNNLARDLHIADSLFSMNEWINFLYRQTDGANGVNKIFAAFSDEFTLHRQDILFHMLAHETFPFKDIVIWQYRITNLTTEIFFDLPSKFAPGKSLCPSISSSLRWGS